MYKCYDSFMSYMLRLTAEPDQVRMILLCVKCVHLFICIDLTFVDETPNDSHRVYVCVCVCA